MTYHTCLCSLTEFPVPEIPLMSSAGFFNCDFSLPLSSSRACRVASQMAIRFLKQRPAHASSQAGRVLLLQNVDQRAARQQLTLTDEKAIMILSHSFSLSLLLFAHKHTHNRCVRINACFILCLGARCVRARQPPHRCNVTL